MTVTLTLRTCTKSSIHGFHPNCRPTDAPGEALPAVGAVRQPDWPPPTDNCPHGPCWWDAGLAGLALAVLPWMLTLVSTVLRQSSVSPRAWGLMLEAHLTDATRCVVFLHPMMLVLLGLPFLAPCDWSGVPETPPWTHNCTMPHDAPRCTNAQCTVHSALFTLNNSA